MGRKKLWWNWSVEDVLASHLDWIGCLISQTRVLGTISEIKKVVSLLHGINNIENRDFVFAFVESKRVEVHFQIRDVLEKQTPQKKYEFVCWLIDELGECYLDEDYEKLRLEVTEASTTKFTGDLGDAWFEEDELRMFYRIPWLHARKDYSQFIFPDIEHILPILCMKIEWCKRQGNYEKVMPSLSIFDYDLLDTLQHQVALFHLEKFIDFVISGFEKSKKMIGVMFLGHLNFENPRNSLDLIFWFINNPQISLEARWVLYDHYAGQKWVGKWSEEFYNRTIENMCEDDPMRISTDPSFNPLFARMFFNSLILNWNKSPHQTDEIKLYKERLSELDIGYFEFPENYGTFVKEDATVIQTINNLLEKMTKEPETFSNGIGELDAWKELLVLFRARDGIEVPIINKPLHNSSELKGVSLLLNVLGHGLNDMPEDIDSWAKLIQRGFEESNYDYEDAFDEGHFIRVKAVNQAGIMIANTNPDYRKINSAINSLFSNSDVGPAMMVGVDLCFKCSMDIPNIKNPGSATNKIIMEHLFSKIKSIGDLDDYDVILSYIIENYHYLKTVDHYDGTDEFLKLIDSKATKTFANDETLKWHITLLLSNEDLLTPKRLSKLQNLLNTELFIDQLISYRDMRKSFNSNWFDVLRESNVDWSSK